MRCLSKYLVGIFAKWLYTDIFSKNEGFWTDRIYPQAESYIEGHKKVSIVLIKSYTFADRFMVPRLRSTVTSTMFTCCLDSGEEEGGPSAFVELVVYAHDNTPARSTIHKLVVDLFCSIHDYYNETSRDDHNVYRRLPAEFKQRAFTEFMKRKREGQMRYALNVP